MSELSRTYRTDPADIPQPVDRLFLKLATRYGTQWFDKWAGTPMEAIKAEWGNAINGVGIKALILAVEYCGKYPPNLPEFLDYLESAKRTIRATEPAPLMIGRKWTEEEMEANKKRLAEIMRNLSNNKTVSSTKEE